MNVIMNYKTIEWTYYVIYDKGIVYSEKSKKYLKSYKNKQWYLIVSMLINWKLTTKYIHRLVAENFIDNVLNKEQVNHIDWNKLNNNISNLEWNTRSENIQHAYDTWLIKKRVWKDNYLYWKFWKYHNRSKKIKQFTKLWQLIKIWDSWMDIQRELNICSSNISQCCLWKNVKTAWGYKWEYI